MSLVDQIVIAACRQYVFEFKGKSANYGSKVYRWELYALAMDIVRDSHFGMYSP